jgi:hypothetical protein
MGKISSDIQYLLEKTLLMLVNLSINGFKFDSSALVIRNCWHIKYIISILVPFTNWAFWRVLIQN